MSFITQYTPGSYSRQSLLNLPKGILLDVHDAVEELENNISLFDYVEYEHYVDGTLNEVLAYIANRDNAKLGIEALASYMREIYNKHGTHEEGTALGEALIIFATQIYNLLVMNNLYSVEGLFTYEFKEWVDGRTALLICPPEILDAKSHTAFYQLKM